MGVKRKSPTNVEEVSDSKISRREAIGKGGSIAVAGVAGLIIGGAAGYLAKPSTSGAASTETSTVTQTVGGQTVTQTVTSTQSAASAAVSAQLPIPDPPPQVQVRFMSLPYVDHSYIIIGIKQGWFNDVGITIVPQPYGDVGTTGEDVLRALVSGQDPIVTSNDTVALASFDKNPHVQGLGYADMFQGYGIMGQASLNLKSFKDFVKQGMAPADAYKAAMAQIKGKRFVYSAADVSLKGFVNLTLSKGGLTTSDFTYIDADDAKGVELMIGGNADFEVGGAPYHVTLLEKGFTEILTSLDLAQYAQPSSDSVEEQSIFPDGWGTTTDYWNSNRETCLRFSSVMHRITRFMVQNPDAALAIHIPFANSITGQTLTTDDGKVIYTKLDPFYTYEQVIQVLFGDINSPLYYAHNTGAYVKLWEDQGALPKGKYQVDDVTLSRLLYAEMERLRVLSEAAISDATNLISQATAKGKDVTSASQLLSQAKTYHDNYDFFDAERFGAAAKLHAQFANS